MHCEINLESKRHHN